MELRIEVWARNTTLGGHSAQKVKKASKLILFPERACGVRKGRLKVNSRSSQEPRCVSTGSWGRREEEAKGCELGRERTVDT